ncbi:MAG: hypothetical protein WCG40_01755 [Actinomycetes bacterium]
MDINQHISATPTEAPTQLQFNGMQNLRTAVNPRFVLSDEICRNGLRHIAEIRQRLSASAQERAASSTGAG